TPAPVTKPAPGAANTGPRRYPFSGLRVLDFGIGGVGVEAGRLLAEYGADVIKIETRAYPDFIRMIAGSEMSPSFASSSRCKRSFGVNLRTGRGLEIMKRLIAVADVVIENSSTGTMEKIGRGSSRCVKSIRGSCSSRASSWVRAAHGKTGSDSA